MTVWCSWVVEEPAQGAPVLGGGESNGIGVMGGALTMLSRPGKSSDGGGS